MYTQLNSSTANPYLTNQKLEVNAIRLYDKATYKSFLAKLKGIFSKDKSLNLSTLNEVLQQATILRQKALGVKTVNINKIVGTTSEGRSRDFDINFRPLQAHNKERWLGVAMAKISQHRLPPVILVQLDDYFFVEDGHHRISVAKAMGEKNIEAKIVKLSVSSTLSTSISNASNKNVSNPILQPTAT